MIAEQIYNGATAKDLNMGEMQYNSRLETINNFLEVWSGNDFKKDFLLFLKEEYRYDKYSRVDQETNIKLSKEDMEDAELTYGKMFSDLAVNLKSIVRSGIKTVNREEHERRYTICLGCRFIEKGRCAKCGCFMKLKSKFESMSCPINLWKKE